MEPTNEDLIAEARRCDQIGPTSGQASLLIARLANALEEALRADREPEPATEAKREHVCYDAAFPEERVQCDCRVGQDHSDDECESLTGHEDPAPATEEGSN